MNYTEIIDLALSYSDRESDPEIPDNMDKFLRIVEARLNRKFRVGSMSTRSIIDLSLLPTPQEYFGFPPNFGGLRDIEWQEELTRCSYTYISPEQMNNVVTNNRTGNTLYYTIVACQFQVYPVKETGTFEIIYYQKVAPLTAGDTTNWISIGNPDAYVFGLIVEISAFAKDKEATALWELRFQTAMAEIDEEDKTDRWSGTPLQVRTG